jgi:hypothetical protein
MKKDEPLKKKDEPLRRKVREENNFYSDRDGRSEKDFSPSGGSR